jgi:hypothetical protein
MKLPENLKNTSGFGKGLPPARYVKGQEGTYSLSFQNEFDHAVWYAAGTPKTPGGKSDKQKEVLAWLMSQGLTYEELKDHRKKILDVIRKQVKTSIAEGSGDIDVPNVNPQFADKEEPEEDILEDLPDDLAASLAAFAAKRGAAIPSETAEKAKKKSSYKSNTKLLGAITEKLSKIQGSLDAVAQSLDRQNTLLQTNIQTNIAIVDSVVESNNVLETKFDALLAAFNAQAVASQQYYENLERAGREYVQDQQRDVASSTSPIDLRGIGGRGNSLLNEIFSSRRITEPLKRQARRFFLGKKSGSKGKYFDESRLRRLRARQLKVLLSKRGTSSRLFRIWEAIDKFRKADQKGFVKNLLKSGIRDSVSYKSGKFQASLNKLSIQNYGTNWIALSKSNPAAAEGIRVGAQALMEADYVSPGARAKVKLDSKRASTKLFSSTIQAARETKVARVRAEKLLKKFKIPKGLHGSLLGLLDPRLGRTMGNVGGMNISRIARRTIGRGGGSGNLKGLRGGRFALGKSGTYGLKRLPGLNVILGSMEYADRKMAGQSNIQAGAGVGGSILGGAVGGSIAAAILKTTAVGAALGGPVGAGIGLLIGIGLSAGGAWAGGAIADKITGADQIQYEQGSNNVGPSTDPAVIVGAVKSFVNQLGPMGEEVKVQFAPEIARLEKIFGAVDPNMESPVGGSIEGRPSPFKKKKTAGTVGEEKDPLDINFDQVVPKGPLDDFLNFFNNAIKNITDNINTITTNGINFISGITSSITNINNTITGFQAGKTVVLAGGTNNHEDPQGIKRDLSSSIKSLKSKGYNVVVVAPNKIAYPEANQAAIEAANAEGATVEDPLYDKDDPLHLSTDSVKAIRKKYPGAIYMGDSNAVRLNGYTEVAGVSKEGIPTGDIAEYAKNLAPAPDDPPPSPTNTSQNSTTNSPNFTPKEVEDALKILDGDSGDLNIPTITGPQSSIMEQIKNLKETPIDNQSSTLDVIIPSSLISSLTIPTSQQPQQPIMFTIATVNSIEQQIINRRLAQ